MMREKLYNYYKENPLRCIMLAALVLRLLAAFFSKGFGMHDDHFLIIESSKSWLHGSDYNNWLPWSQGENPIPSGHSFFYPGLMYFLFGLLQFIGIESLNAQMYVVRILHALWSLLVVFYGYKITEKYSNTKVASAAGWVLALYYFMPWLSVRNLVEIVAIPFLMMATWLYIKDESPKFGRVLCVGLLMGLGMSVRYQVSFFIGGFGLALLIMKRWKDVFAFGIGVVLSFSIVQCIPDMILWHRPFAEFGEYISYNINMDTAKSYYDQPWYNFVLVILGLMIPPVSVFIFGGYLYEWEKWTLFLPSFAFLVIHSCYPNKQERFILTIFPFIIILGIIGLYDFIKKNPERLKFRKTLKVCFYISLVLNMIALIPVTLHYSKKARVESMIYLSHYPDSQYYILEGMLSNGVRMPVEEYADRSNMEHEEVFQGKEWPTVAEFINEKPVSFVLFEGEENLEERVAEAKKYLPELVYETICTESFIDALVQKMNPVNENYPIVIYRNAAVVEECYSNKY